MGGILCPAPHELWPLGMAATYSIPEKVHFDEESLSLLTAAGITPGVRFALNNLRFESPQANSTVFRIQCLRALCTIENVHFYVLPSTNTPAKNHGSKKTVSFSLNFTYSTAVRDCEVQFHLYAKVGKGKRRPMTSDKVVEKSLFQSPVVKLKANSQKNVFQSALADIAIDNSHAPAYLHYKKAVHPGVFDVVIVVGTDLSSAAADNGSSTMQTLVKALSNRSMGGSAPNSPIKSPENSNLPSRKPPPSSKQSIFPSLFYRSVTPEQVQSNENIKYNIDSTRDGRFTYLEKQVYYVCINASSLQSHLASMGIDMDNPKQARRTGEEGGKKKKKQKNKRTKQTPEGQPAASEMFNVSPDRSVPGTVGGTGKGGDISYTILNNFNSSMDEKKDNNNQIVKVDSDDDVDENERLDLVKEVLGSPHSPAYFSNMSITSDLSPPIINTNNNNTTPTQHNKGNFSDGSTNTTPASPSKSPQKLPFPTPGPNSRIDMDIKEHRYVLPYSDKFYLAKAIYDLRYNIGSTSQPVNPQHMPERDYLLSHHQPAGGNKAITFPSILGGEEAMAMSTRSLCTPVMPFEEGSVLANDKKDDDDDIELPDFVRNKNSPSQQCILKQETRQRANSTASKEENDTGGECVVCLVNKRNCIIFPCRHTNTCLDCAQLYIHSNLNDPVNNTPKCPVCRENIAILLHIV